MMNIKLKTKIIRIVILLATIAALSVGLFFLFKGIGVTDINSLQQIIKNCGAWGVVVFMALQVLCTILLCFVPGTSMTFITVGVIMFGANVKTFLICFGSVLIASFIMDLIGRFGGSKLICKLVGKKTYNDALALIQTKGVVYVPVMYLLPIFPDDAICMCCGALKMKWWIHYIEIVLCRGIGCATIVFGINLLPVDLMNNLKELNWEFIGAHMFEYITMITVLTFWVLILLSLARRIDKWLTKKLKSKGGSHDERHKKELHLH